MACCVVAAILLALLHRLTPWRRRSPDVAAFAPPARRGAPGDPAPADAVPAPAPKALRPGAALWAWTLKFASLGACMYLAAVALLITWGQAHSMATGFVWVVRTGVIGAAAFSAAALAVALHRRGEDRSSPMTIVGCAAIGIAVAVLELTAFDMHLLALYHLGPAIHDAVHFGCWAAFGVGVLLVLPGLRGPASARPAT